MAKFTDDELLAAILDIHNRDRWGGWTLMRDSPLRRTLISDGYLDSGARRPGNVRRRGWFLTAKARRRLIDVPGSGITSSPTHKFARPG